MANAKIETSSEFKTEIVEVKKKVVVLTLSESEAQFLHIAVGNIFGTGPGRAATDAVYKALDDAGVDGPPGYTASRSWEFAKYGLI